MAAIVYNGVIRGTGNHVVQTLYTNSTGGNVRVLWNWIEVGQGSDDDARKLYYGSTAPANGDINHTSGNNLSTIEIPLKRGIKTGKDIAWYVQGTYTNFRKMSGGNNMFFPLEIMLANTHKISLWTDSNLSSSLVAIIYNFVVIPE